MTRYLLSLAVFFAGVVLAIFLSGGAIWPYIDIPSLLIVGVVPFIFVSILFGFKNMASVFSVPFKNEATEDKLKTALAFFRVYGKTVWLAGIISVLIGAVAILAFVEDKTRLGPNFAIVLISLLYSAIINLTVVLPYTVLIKKRMKE